MIELEKWISRETKKDISSEYDEKSLVLFETDDAANYSNANYLHHCSRKYLLVVLLKGKKFE